MSEASGNAYRAYVPKPIRPEERGRIALLFGGLTWRTERAFEAVLANAGHRGQRLPDVTRADLIRGRELADIGQCCPTAFTTGNLVNFLEARAREIGREAVLRDYAYVTAGSCGSCRFGQYHQSYSLALKNSGLGAFRMFLAGQTVSDGDTAETDGLELDFDSKVKLAFSILVGDVLQDLEYQIRPFEIDPGSTDRAVKAAVDDVCAAIRSLPRRKYAWTAGLWALTTRDFYHVLRKARRHFEGIRLDRLRVKPIVKITGEFYLQTVENAANYNIHSWLEHEGAVVYPAAVAIWGDYLMRFDRQAAKDRKGLQPGTRKTQAQLGFGQWALRFHHDRLRHALGDVPHAMPPQEELRELAAPFFDGRLNGGEGDMLVGKALWALKHRKAHMICELSPYGCLPNTMSIGAMAAVQGKHPDLLYAPLEIKGDSEVHALSRCQMLLTEAKSRAREEFRRALSAARLTEEEARAAYARRTDMHSPFWKVPDRGAVGVAANVVLELGRARL